MSDGPTASGRPTAVTGGLVSAPVAALTAQERTLTDMARLTLEEVASLIACRELGAEEYVQALLDRIAVIDSQTHAFLDVRAAEGLAEARACADDLARGRSARPLEGIPFAVKDLIDVEGLSTTCQSRVAPSRAAVRDAAVVASLRSLGAIFLGKLTLEEFGVGAPEDDTPWPAARNPWDLTRTAGGSSSGAGAAVAAGLVPLAIGTDTGGSVRCPAAMCGAVGMKPTFGMLSTAGVFPLAPSLDTLGLVTRTVADCATVWDALGVDQLSRDDNRVARPRVGEEPLHGIRIGVIRHFFTADLPAAPEIAAAVEAAVSDLESGGARITDVYLAEAGEYEACGATILGAEAYAVHADWLASRGNEYGAVAQASLRSGASICGAQYGKALLRRAELQARWRAALLRHELDAVVTAVSPGVAWRIGDLALRERHGDRSMRMAFNVLGTPALALPIGVSGDGLPIAMQLAAPHGGEHLLYRIGCAFERRRARPELPI